MLAMRMKWQAYHKLTIVILAVLSLIFILDTIRRSHLRSQNEERLDWQLVDAVVNEVGLPFDIVPNYVHYILFDVHEIEFGHFISLLSVLKNQRPERIYIHCNCHQLTGDYYNRVIKVSDELKVQIVIRYTERPTEVFGHRLSEQWLNWHSSDLIRIRVLMELGGVYLDRDMYVVRPLTAFFKYEMTLQWDDGQEISNQIMIAHPNARYLRLLYDSYRFYDPKVWNSVQRSQTTAILETSPRLAHRLRGVFGCNGRELCSKLYSLFYKEWQEEYYSIHLMIRNNRISWPQLCAIETQINEFDEQSIRQLNVTFGELSRIVLDFETNVSAHYVTSQVNYTLYTLAEK